MKFPPASPLGSATAIIVFIINANLRRLGKRVIVAPVAAAGSGTLIDDGGQAN
jgi:hypothetical protein